MRERYDQEGCALIGMFDYRTAVKVASLPPFRDCNLAIEISKLVARARFVEFSFQRRCALLGEVAMNINIASTSNSIASILELLKIALASHTASTILRLLQDWHRVHICSNGEALRFIKLRIRSVIVTCLSSSTNLSKLDKCFA
jgi:hypothetical protein